MVNTGYEAKSTVALEAKKERKQVWLYHRPGLLSVLNKPTVVPAHLMAGHPAY